MKNNFGTHEEIREEMKASGNLVSEDRTVETFNKIYGRGGSPRIILSYGEPSIKIESSKNIIDKITTEVKNGELIIGVKPGQYNNEMNYTTVYVSTNDLESIKIKSGTNIISDDTFTVDNIDFDISGGGHIKLALNANDVYSGINGGGILELTGQITNLTAHINGGGILEASENMNIKNADMNVNGGGRAEVNAETLSRAYVSGGGNLYYKGEPVIKNLDISGGGRIDNF